MRLKTLLSVAAAYLLLHALCLVLFPANNYAISYLFVFITPLLAFAACNRQVRSGNKSTRVSWNLLSLGLLIWSSGTMVLVWEELVEHVSPQIASFADFNLFIYGIPVLFAISMPAHRDGVPLLVWLDAIQAAVTAYLIYVAFFSVSPFAHSHASPIPAHRLILIYSIESLLLAVGSSLRLLAQRRSYPSFHFYKILSLYLWLYAVCIGLLNYAYLTRSGVTGFFDLAADLPFLYLAIATTLAPLSSSTQPPSMDRRPFVLFADNLSPIFYTVALFALCLFIMRTSFSSGLASLMIALAVYALRQTALQSRYMKTHLELLKVRDRLEEISLTDSLTGVSNRRCFDQTLNHEWDRAVRTKHPLSLLMIDADHFKSLNDRHGHQYGDECLRRIAEGMRSVLPRSGDLLARYGGEEFVILLPTTGRFGAQAVAARMLETINTLEIAHESPTGPCATVSIGFSVAEFPTEKTLHDLIRAADIALYCAKASGRNQVHYSPIEDPILTSRSVVSQQVASP